jgi:hypothetical protein
MSDLDCGLVSELLQSIADGLREGDMPAHLQAWLRVASGHVSADSRAPRVTAAGREALALSLAGESAAGVTSSELAAAAHLGPESARLLLKGLAKQGKLEPRGANKGRYYVVPRG